ncbi:MAG TPA: P27 family phage terminase small subunit [Candidatus Paceibacterota bacterium]|nr:P27 family phage terminase small subunit [Candidatus Paceibacterota bacterium]
MGGRPPKSIKIHLLEKEKVYGKIKTRIETEPIEKNKKLKTKCPKNFNKNQRKIWNKYKKILDQFGLLNIANSEILTLLVRNISEREECIDEIDLNGIICKENGKQYQNPYWIIKNKCEENIIKHLNLLGLSSMGLAKLGCLQAESKKKKSDMQKMLG